MFRLAERGGDYPQNQVLCSGTKGEGRSMTQWKEEWDLESLWVGGGGGGGGRAGCARWGLNVVSST